MNVHSFHLGIGCSGEVGIHQAEGYGDWGIEIRVKFRKEEALQRLTGHRQSGGVHHIDLGTFCLNHALPYLASKFICFSFPCCG